MEERGALLPDVDEGGLEAGENTCDLSEVHVADSAGLTAFSFDVELGDDAVFDQRGARLAEITAEDEDILGHWRESLSRPRRRRASLRLSTWRTNGNAPKSPRSTRRSGAPEGGAASGQRCSGSVTRSTSSTPPLRGGKSSSRLGRRPWGSSLLEGPPAALRIERFRNELGGPNPRGKRKEPNRAKPSVTQLET